MIETCVLCGYSAGQLPYAGIGRADLRTNTGEMTAHPVCAQCFEHPEHRTVTGVKLHYMPRYLAPQAASAAREMDAKSKRGEELAL